MKAIDPNIPLVVDPEEMLPKVEKMLYDLAWKFHRQYPLLSFEEAKSKAYWGFMEACQKYKAKKGASFSTWCYFSVWCNLKDQVMHGSRDMLVLTEMDDDLCGEAPPVRSDVHDLVSDLPHDARLMVAMLLETPGELLGLKMTPRQFLNKVKEHLIRHHGRSQEQVDEACGMIRNRLQEAWK